MIKPYLSSSGQVCANYYEFTYDNQSRRIKRSYNGGSVKYYFYDSLEPIFELDGNGNIVTEQFSIGGELIAKSVQYPVPALRSLGVVGSSVQQKTYHLNDNLGSTVFVLDSAGNLLANHYHDPFGKAWNVKGDIGNDVRFTGKEYEEDIGLYYFAMRWYDPEVGRFISPDPFEPSAYVYCANNPLKYIDLTGLYLESSLIRTARYIKEGRQLPLAQLINAYLAICQVIGIIEGMPILSVGIEGYVDIVTSHTLNEQKENLSLESLLSYLLVRKAELELQNDPDYIFAKQIKEIITLALINELTIKQGQLDPNDPNFDKDWTKLQEEIDNLNK